MKEIGMQDLKDSLALYIKQWELERDKLNKENEDSIKLDIKYTAMIYIAQWIINSHKNSAIDITKILNN